MLSTADMHMMLQTSTYQPPGFYLHREIARILGIRGLLQPGKVAWRAVLLAAELPHLTPTKQVAAFLSRLTYLKEPGRRDRWQSAERTLWRGGGDCEDLALLGMSLLRALGQYDVKLVVGTIHVNGRRPEGHAWLEGRDREGWFLLEATTGQLFRMGRPRAYAAREALAA